MKHCFLFPAVWALVGCSFAVAQTKMNPQLNATDAQFVRDAIASGQHEIEMGKMALKQSNDPTLKGFAQGLVNDHIAAGKRLDEIAGAPAPAPATVPATTAALQADIINRGNEVVTQNANSLDQPVRTDAGQLNATTSVPSAPRTDPPPRTDDAHMDSHIETMMGANFDKAWAKQMVEDHKAAIAKFEAEQKDAQNADLRNFVSTTLPTLKEHLAKAQALDK